jgi:hypothetical protein
LWVGLRLFPKQGELPPAFLYFLISQTEKNKTETCYGNYSKDDLKVTIGDDLGKDMEEIEGLALDYLHPRNQDENKKRNQQ